MKKTICITALLLGIIALAACSRPTPAPLPTPTPTFEPLILLPTAQPTVQLPTPTTVSLVYTPTARAYDPIPAEVIFDNYFLRSGPGRMFETLRMYATGERVLLLAREPGNNWVLVQTADNRSGWMNVVGLQFTGDVTPLPIFTVPDAQVLRGHVWRTDKSAASGIGVSIASVTEPSPDREDVSSTNTQGEWYLYLPPDMDGEWVIGVNSYGCESNAVDSNCNLLGKIPAAQKITLPLAASVNFEFALEP